MAPLNPRPPQALFAMTNAHDYDVLIIGGGPSGATAALVLARAGVRVAILEKAEFPRFQIGESFLPANLEQIKRLGLHDRLRALPHMPKYGAEFGMGVGPTSVFQFNTSLVGGENETFNTARAEFDAMVLDAARQAGAIVHQPAQVRSIDRLADGHVAVTTDAGSFTGRYLLDASGQATVVARHLGTRQQLADQHLRKVAYFGHFENVQRLDSRLAGCPCIIMCDEGWFWLIALDEKRTSVGLVLEPEVVKRVGLPADQMLQWGIDRCPTVRERMKHAVGSTVSMVRSDFSYRCEPYAGPGYFLVGDAAVFLDPVFSTGVCMGMMSAEHVAHQLIDVLRGSTTPAAARKRHIRYVRGSSDVYFRVIRHYYNHHFRELFLTGQGPMQMHRAVLGLLAGHVFPRPRFNLWWRFRAFELVLKLQRHFTLAPRRQRFSLLNQAVAS
jgi:flavin-dependent dehydrogenase